ncbi:Ig-like domain-containing protein [Bacillus sp. AK128]
MKNLRLIMILVSFLFYSLFPTQLFGNLTAVQATETEPPLTINPGHDRIKIQMEDSDEPLPTPVGDYIKVKLNFENFILVGEKIDLVKNLTIFENHEEIDPLTVIDQINVVVNDSSVATYESGLIKGSKLGETQFEITYKNMSIYLKVYVVEEIERTYTISVPKSLESSYVETMVYGYNPNFNGYSYVSHDRKVESINDSTQQVQITINAGNLERYSDLRALISYQGAIHLVELDSELSKKVEIDDTYTTLVFPDYFFRGIELERWGYSTYVNLSKENTLQLPKGPYTINASYTKEYQQANREFFISSKEISAYEQKKEITFEDTKLGSLKIEYQGRHDYVNGYLQLRHSSRNWSLPHDYKKEDIIYLNPGNYNLGLQASLNDFHLFMVKNLEIDDNTYIKTSPNFNTELDLNEIYTAGETLEIDHTNVSYMNSDGFQLEHLHKANSSFTRTLTLTNVNQPEETYSFTLDGELYSYDDIVLPQTEGTFDVTLTFNFNEPPGEEIPPTVLSLAAKDLVMHKDNTIPLEVYANYSNGTSENISVEATYTVEDPSIIEIINGQVSALAGGNTTVSIEHLGKTASFTVTVIDEQGEHNNPLIGITTPETSFFIEEGKFTPVQVIAFYENGDEVDVTELVSYNSSDPTIAYVENGNIFGINQGVATIFVQYEDQTIEMEVTVTAEQTEPENPENPIQSIITNLNYYSVKPEVVSPLSVQAKYENGEIEDITQHATYESSNPDIAIVQDGHIIGLKYGETSITVRYKGLSITFEVSVDETVPALVKLALNQEKYELTHYNSLEHTVTAHYDNGETKDVTNEVKVTSSNTNVIQIINGKIKAANTGLSTLSFTYQGSNVQAEVKVVPYLLKLQSSSTTFELEKGMTTQLALEAVYSDRTKKDITHLATYQVESSTIAEVSESGLVTGISDGEVLITASYEGKEFSFEGKVLLNETGFEFNLKEYGSNSMISGAKVLLQRQEKTEFNELAEKSSGYFKEELPAGLYDVLIYKKGYLPMKEQFLVEERNITSKTIELEKSDLIAADFEVNRMEPEEIQAAGIDINDPDNRWTYKFEAHLAFQGKFHDVEFMGNSKGRIFNPEPVELNGGYKAYPYLISVGSEENEVIPMLAYMVVPGEVSWLKEFFSAQLMIQNLSPEPFSLINSKITLELPEGLSLAEGTESQTLEVELGDILGGETIYHEWYIRGDRKGDYHVRANFNGTLNHFNVPVHGEFITQDPIKVWGDDALKMYIEAEGTAEAGMAYRVRVRLENITDTSIYYLDFKLLEEGKKNYFFSPNTQLEYSFNELKAKEEVILDFLLIPLISGTLDLSHSFMLKTGGNAQIETVISTIN